MHKKELLGVIVAIVGNYNQCELGRVAIIRYSPFEAW